MAFWVSVLILIAAKEKRPRLFDDAFEIQGNLTGLKIHCDIPFIFSRAHIDHLHTQRGFRGT